MEEERSRWEPAPLNAGITSHQNSRDTEQTQAADEIPGGIWTPKWRRTPARWREGRSEDGWFYSRWARFSSDKPPTPRSKTLPKTLGSQRGARAEPRFGCEESRTGQGRLRTPRRWEMPQAAAARRGSSKTLTARSREQPNTRRGGGGEEWSSPASSAGGRSADFDFPDLALSLSHGSDLSSGPSRDLVPRSQSRTGGTEKRCRRNASWIPF